MRKLKHFHARVLKYFSCQNVSAFAGLLPAEVMGELAGIHKVFLTTQISFLVVAPIASDSRDKGSYCAPPTAPRCCYSPNEVRPDSYLPQL